MEGDDPPVSVFLIQILWELFGAWDLEFGISIAAARRRIWKGDRLRERQGRLDALFRAGQELLGGPRHRRRPDATRSRPRLRADRKMKTTGAKGAGRFENLNRLPLAQPSFASAL